MQKIVLLNPKGGSGKTTIATNLASYYAVAGLRPTLMDMDAQGSTTRWLSKRAKGQPTIHGIAGFERNSRVTRSFATRLPVDTERLVVDTAAAVEPQKLPDLTRNATAILVPVLPSDIDIHAADSSHCHAARFANLHSCRRIRHRHLRSETLSGSRRSRTVAATRWLALPAHAAHHRTGCASHHFSVDVELDRADAECGDVRVVKQ